MVGGPRLRLQPGQPGHRRIHRVPAGQLVQAAGAGRRVQPRPQPRDPLSGPGPLAGARLLRRRLRHLQLQPPGLRQHHTPAGDPGIGQHRLRPTRTRRDDSTTPSRLARNLGLSRIDPDHNYGASLALGAAESSPLEMAIRLRNVRQPGSPDRADFDPAGTRRRRQRLDRQSGPASANGFLDETVADNVTVRAHRGHRVGNRTGCGHRPSPPPARPGRPRAYRAAWFVGYTPQLSTAVWMGHADRLASLRNVNGCESRDRGIAPRSGLE